MFVVMEVGRFLGMFLSSGTVCGVRLCNSLTSSFPVPELFLSTIGLYMVMQ